MKEKILIIDGHNLLFKMFYGIPASIKNSEGKEIKSLVGFLGSIKKFIKEFNPRTVIVVFDSESSASSNKLLDIEYKSNRLDYSNISEDENPFLILPAIKKALNYLEIPNIEVTNSEEDDYIASLTNNNLYEYIIVSTDTDFIQLINDNTYLYIPRGKKSILYNKDKVYEKYNTYPNQYILYKSLIGDKSDNIKGIKGIGRVTAAKILKYQNIESYIKQNSSNKISKLLIENKNRLLINIKLITLNKYLDIGNIKINVYNSELINKKVYEIISEIGEL